MSLKQVGQNGVNEFFEDLTYNVAYSEILARLNKIVDVGNDTINDSLKSALTIMVSGALFLYIQKQEEFLYKIYGIVGLIVASQLGFLKKGFSKFTNKIKGRKGRFLKNLFGAFSDERQNQINISRLAVSAGSMVVSGDNNLNTGSSNFNMYQSIKKNAYDKENLNLNIARSKVASMNETLLFKLFAKKFTNNDKELIRRMTGNAGEVDIDTLNKVANFMYVTDDKGEITGLTEEFMSMLNGLGYMHNKVNKNA